MSANITTVFQPTVTITVSDQELASLLAQNLVLTVNGGPPIVRPVLPPELQAELVRQVLAAMDPAGALATSLQAYVSQQVAIRPDDAGRDLWLLIGQSNTSGRGAPYDIMRYDNGDARIEQYGSTGTYAGVISTAVEPLAMHDVPSGIGPGLAFARWYAQAIPTGRRVLLVPAAHGGTRLSTSETPLGWRRGVAGNLYAQAVAQAQAALIAAGPNSRYAGVIWVQGESDGDSNTTGAAYQADFDALIAGLRSDLGVSDLPFIVGQMVPDYLTTGTRAQINAVHVATPSRVGRTAFSPGIPGQNMGDGNHYNAIAQRAIGRNMYDAWRRIVNAQPDPALPTAPDQVASVTASSTGVANWVAAARAAVYVIEYRVVGTTPWVRGGSTSGLTFALSSLNASTNYELRVTAVNTGGPGTPSTTAAFTTAGVPAITDSFNRVDNTTSLGSTDTGQTWTPNATVWGIASNRATMVSGSNGRATVESGRSNCSVQVTFSTLSAGSNHGRLLFRGDASTNYWMAQLRVTGGVPGKYQLYKSVAGSLTQVGSDSTNNGAAGDVVKAVLSNDSITITVNGTAVISVTDSFNNTATQHGLAAVGNGPTFDDFSITS